MNICINCGHEFEGKFCPECGTPNKNKEKTNKCTNCGNEFEGKFCPKCGTKGMDVKKKIAEKITDFKEKKEKISPEYEKMVADIKEKVVGKISSLKIQKGKGKIIGIVAGIMLILLIVVPFSRGMLASKTIEKNGSQVADPIIDEKSGAYESIVSIKYPGYADTKETVTSIYYTIDGSDPTVDNGTLAKGESNTLRITDGGITVKAIAFNEKGNKSNIIERKFDNSKSGNTTLGLSIDDKSYLD